MHSAANLRRQIESALHVRIPGALTPLPHTKRDLVLTGIQEIDTLLDGGLPTGAITELVGPLCSGRSTLALAVLAGLTKQQEAVAWIDTADTLDPESAAAAGIHLTHQLWVRCSHASSTLRRPSLESCLAPNAAGTALLLEGSRTPVPPGGGGSPHPRGEVRGLSQAISAVLKPGTPGAPNRKLTVAVPEGMKVLSYRATNREEQTAPERLPPRRSGNLSAAQIAHTGAVAEAQAKQRQSSIPASFPSMVRDSSFLHNKGPYAAAEMEAHADNQSPSIEHSRLTYPPRSQQRPLNTIHSLAGSPFGKAHAPVWKALDQALRATDLILTTGGFSAVVLDLGSTAPEFAWRIPLTTWFRLRAAAERTHTVFLLLPQHSCARSSAELILRLGPLAPRRTETVLTGADFQITVDRRRFEPSMPPPATTPQIHLISNRKPVHRERATSWQRQPVWAHGGA